MAKDFYHTGLAVGRSDCAKVLDITDGAVSASKAIVVDASSNIASGLNVIVSAAMITGAFTFPSTPRTATATGATTGTIADAGLLQFVPVTAKTADATGIIILPTPTPGTIVVLSVGATGYELRSSSPTTIGINGGTGADVESAIAATTTVVAICESATAWKAFQLTGTAGTLEKTAAAS